MKCRPGLTLRLWLGAAALAALAVAAAALAAWGPGRLQFEAAEALAAQRRLEAYGAYQSRSNEWLLGWLAGALAPGGSTTEVMDLKPDSLPVLAALQELDRLILEDVGRAVSEAEANQRARQTVTLARLRALFSGLEASLAAAPPQSPTGQLALSYHSSQAPLILAQAFDQESRRRDHALSRMEALRAPLLWAAALLALAAPLVLAALYLGVLRPLFARLAEASRTAPLLATGRLAPGAGGHDELGLMFARQRQMAARIGRRQARLEAEITERTAALAAANQRLAQIDATRRRFFADVGHELRTPLTVILGEAELGAAHADPEVRSSFHTVAARALRLYRRIEDMLRIARSESGQLELQVEPVDLRLCLAAAQADLAPVLQRAGITVQIDVPQVILSGDGEWLRQVFAGFFDNAAKHAGPGAVMRLLAQPAPEPGFIALRIEDNGSGAAAPAVGAASADAVFDRFSRRSSAAGFGLGLALAQWVVETSGGSLRLAAMPAGAGFGLDLVLPLWKEG